MTYWNDRNRTLANADQANCRECSIVARLNQTQGLCGAAGCENFAVFLDRPGCKNHSQPQIGGDEGYISTPEEAVDYLISCRKNRGGKMDEKTLNTFIAIARTSFADNT